MANRRPWSQYSPTHRLGNPLSEEMARRVAERAVAGVEGALERFGEAAIPADSPAGQALAAFREMLEVDLGGRENLSTQERLVVDLVTRQLFLLDVIDAFLLIELQGRAFSKRDKTLYPIATQRQSIADSIVRYLGVLGLQRRAKPVERLQDYIARKEKETAP